MVEFKRWRRSLWVSRECEREFHTVALTNLHLSTIIVKLLRIQARLTKGDDAGEGRAIWVRGQGKRARIQVPKRKEQRDIKHHMYGGGGGIRLVVVLPNQLDAGGNENFQEQNQKNSKEQCASGGEQNHAELVRLDSFEAVAALRMRHAATAAPPSLLVCCLIASFDDVPSCQIGSWDTGIARRLTGTRSSDGSSSFSRASSAKSFKFVSGRVDPNPKQRQPSRQQTTRQLLAKVEIVGLQLADCMLVGFLKCLDC
ncbi:hypothetical protein M5K25_027363 [Dendrobium thyrsiflorum]|uniref:Uncharacterized protein n=1 Tax=Dendrobium thyrsiflorum TaxID=117978 RepID=A0ABD0TZY4_DENTH